MFLSLSCQSCFVFICDGFHLKLFPSLLPCIITTTNNPLKQAISFQHKKQQKENETKYNIQ